MFGVWGFWDLAFGAWGFGFRVGLSVCRVCGLGFAGFRVPDIGFVEFEGVGCRV